MKLILNIPSIDKEEPTAETLIEWFRAKIGEEESPMRYVESVELLQDENR